MLPQLGVADRGRSHVDATASLPQIERCADYDNFTIGRLHAHGRKAIVAQGMGGHFEGGVAAPVRVLLADDDDAFLDSIQPLIEHQPELTVVGRAPDGLVAIELADALSPDAVVIDLHMPLVDGVTAVARLRKDHPSLCLIALTGDPAAELHQAVSDAGADAVLLKGTLVDTLLERLAAVCTAAPT
jgi:CheY-like chemotaxis protein